jgi:hypothetical protein
MILSVPRIAATCLLLSVTGVLVAGCGGSGSKAAQNVAEARDVATANAACRKFKNEFDAFRHGRGAGVSLLADNKTEFAAIRAAMKSAPRAGTFLADLATARRFDYGEAPLVNGAPPLTALHRANVQVYDDEKALGLNACLAPRDTVVIR